MKGISLKKKNILITGATGFVGGSLMKRLEQLGASVYGVSRKSKAKNIFTISVLDYEKIKQLVQKKDISICFHLAGEALVEAGQDRPYDTFKTNIEGTLNMLEIARSQKFEKIIIASSSHVYGRNKVPYFEGYMPRPSRPYETSKACMDLVAKSYADTFNLPVLIPRFVNIYGPGDMNLSRLIPRTIKSILNGSNPKMWGGDAVRDYLYIDDAIDAYISLVTVAIKKVGNNRIFNFGSNNTISVKNLIDKIIAITGKDMKIEKIINKREAEIKSQYVSFKKANRLLHWSPRIELDEGLTNTIAWYKKFYREVEND